MLGTMEVIRTASKAWQHLLGLILPPTCACCGTQLESSAPLGFCLPCHRTLPWWDTTRVLPPQLPPGIQGFSAPCLYEEPLRSLILNFKFSDATHLAPPLTRLMVPHLPAYPPETTLLVPVPLHPSRLRQRLYNQSALLAQGLGRITGQTVRLNGLTRLTKTDHQSAKTRIQRQNLRGTDFKASSAVQGRHVILIDDILTTGATARACALALKRGGALSVHVTTLAYTPPA